LVEKEYSLPHEFIPEGQLFPVKAVGLKEQREERRRTIEQRCSRVSELVNDTGEPALVWCHLNDEGDHLTRMIPDAVQVSGSDSDEAKEERLLGFARGDYRVLVTKPKIGAWGLNYQHCAHITFFPSHSFEQYYQGVRRCWRFGQKRPVTVDLVSSEGEVDVMKNLQRKAKQADEMFDQLVLHMHDALSVERTKSGDKSVTVPSWL
jgi:superfamily II DNA/RNA helicase